MTLEPIQPPIQVAYLSKDLQAYIPLDVPVDGHPMGPVFLLHDRLHSFQTITCSSNKNHSLG